MLSDRLTLTTTERTAMFRAESLDLLARRRPRLRDRTVNQEGGARAPLLREPMPAEDPDDSIDPDDSGPRLSVTLKEARVGETCVLPAAQAEETSGRCPDTGEGSKGPQSAAGAPAPPDLLDPAVLRTMPPRVAAFML